MAVIKSTARLQAVEEPQSLLRESNRKLIGAFFRRLFGDRPGSRWERT